jgi:type IV pilus assembly protein PilE
MNKVLKSTKGFTLIELMVVIIIIAVLSTVAVPIYQNYTLKAKQGEVLMITHDLATSMGTWQAQSNTYVNWTPNNNSAPVTSPHFTFALSASTVSSYTIDYTVTASGTSAGSASVAMLRHTDGIKDVVTCTIGGVNYTLQ